MAAELDILIQVRDEASRQLQALNRELGGVGKSGQQAGQQLGVADKALGNLKAAAIGAGTALAAAFVTDKLVQFGKDAVNAASNLQESISKTNVVFGESSDEVRAWAETAATSFGQSEQQALEAASTLGNLFTAMGVTGEAASDMSMDLVQLASDLASFNNIGTDEALEKLRSGLVGEVEPLRTLGVQLSAAAVEAKALELGLADTADQLTSQDKVMARYKLILEQTTTAQGDFERTSDGLANQQRILSSQWEDLQATIGTALLPAMTDLVSTSNDLMGSPLFSGGLEATAESVAGLTENVRAMSAVFGEASGVVKGLGIDLGPVGGFLGDMTKEYAGLALLGPTLGPIAAGIKATGIASEEAKQPWSEFNKALLDNSLEAAGVDIDDFVETVKEAAQALGDGSTEIEHQAEAQRDATAAMIEYNEHIQLVRDNQWDWEEAASESVAVMVELADASRHGTEDGHRYNQMLEDQAGAYDAVAVKAGLLASTQASLATVNDIMNQRIDESAGAISHWEDRVSGVDEALGYLDEQLAAGNITQEEYGEKTRKLTEYNDRLKQGIEDDLVPAYIDEQLAAADLQTALDDLDQKVKDGTISQGEAEAQARDLKEAFEEQQNPVGALIDKIGELIDTLIDLENEDPTVTITANADAVQQAIEDMRAYAANNPINVPIYGVTAGGNDAPAPVSSAGGGESSLQGARSSTFQLGSEHGAVYGDGFATGAAENVKQLMPDLMTDALNSIAHDFTGAGIVDIMTGAEGDRLQDDAKALEAYMQALIQAGFGPESEAYKEARLQYEEIMAMLEAISAIAGTEAAQAFWEEYLDAQKEWQWPERAAQEAADNIWRSPGWEEGGIKAGINFSDAFAWQVREGFKNLPGEIIAEPDVTAGWIMAGQEHAGLYMDAFNEAVTPTMEDQLDALNGDPTTTDTGPSGGGGGGPAGGSPVGFLAGSVAIDGSVFGPGPYDSGFLYEQSLLQNPNSRQNQQQPVNIYLDSRAITGSALQYLGSGAPAGWAVGE